MSAVGIAAVFTLASLLSVMAENFKSADETYEMFPKMESQPATVVGRIVSLPGKTYRQAFKASIKLGQCPLVMESGSIKTCSYQFTGEEIFIPKASMTVDVSRVQSSEDILLHTMGGAGVSIGVLGLISVTPKVKVAVTTNTNRKTLNLISSYEMTKGVITLQNAKPKTVVSDDSALFLSEIEIGGNELLLVSLEFESEKKKVEVEVSVTFKILFITISAKLKHVHQNFKSKAKVRVQFKSSWRKELDETFSRLEDAIPRVEQIEAMYMKGPEELRKLSNEDENAHNMYYFSSWKQSPYGLKFNQALVNHDLDFLTEQNTEMKSVINRINNIRNQLWDSETRKKMVQLNETLTDKTEKLTTGLDEYHKLSLAERQKLRDIYGSNNAPLYYQRMLEKIIA